jgi:hypothetical protein
VFRPTGKAVHGDIGAFGFSGEAGVPPTFETMPLLQTKTKTFTLRGVCKNKGND